MKQVVITGGTGLIGQSIVYELVKQGYAVTILTRNSRQNSDKLSIRYSYWDIDKDIIDKEVIANAHYIIHLAGANVAEKRWTAKRKKEIAESRIKSGQLLSKTIIDHATQLEAFVSASAIGWYGPDPVIPNPHPFTEDATHHNDFLGNTCYQWEQSIQPIIAAGKRTVVLRTGIVLSNEGGALPEYLKPLRYALAVVMGSGKQRISWIHIDDLTRMYIDAMKSEKYAGVYNAVAPMAVSNRDFVKELANRVKGKFYTVVNAPTFLLKIILGEMSIEVLKSATVSAKKIQQAGFSFQYPTLAAALQGLVKK